MNANSSYLFSRPVALILAASLLGACAPVPSRSDAPRAPAPVIATPMPPPRPALPPAKPITPPRPRAEAPAPTMPSAIAALLQEAEEARSAGRLEEAAANLERAIRIRPRNPQVWQQLAIIRLEQGQPELAEDLAKKSNVLAQGDRALSQKNWTLIAEARRRRGDVQGAADAQAKAQALKVP